MRFATCPGRAYNAELEKDFEHASPDSEEAFLASLRGGDSVQVKAGAHVATSIARTSDGHMNVFFANFAGLVGGSNPVQTLQTGVEVSVSLRRKVVHSSFLFLAKPQAVHGVRHGDSVSFTLPPITKGAVFWYEP